MTATSRQDRVLARLAAFRAGLAPHLGAAFDALDRRLSLTTERAPGYFRHPLALPVLDLPAWVGDACARAGRPVPAPAVDDAVEAAAFGYLHVRVQDDLLDEGEGSAAEALLLAEALFLRHQVLLVGVVGAAASFWAEFARLWQAYGEAMLLEHDLYRRGGVPDAATFDRVLDRSRPLALPALAVLTRAGCDGRGAELNALVSHLVRAHQLYTDLLDIEKDRRHGNPTWLVRRFSDPPGAGPDAAADRAAAEADAAGALRRRLFLEGGFDEVLADVEADHRAVEDAAARLDLPELTDFLTRRRAHVAEAREVAYRALFAALLD